jgi:RNA polymerase I-specific transcription initiation factor RRN3
MQFARVAQATDFIYCYTILESNKRLEHTGTSTSTPHPATVALNQLTTPTTILALNKSDSGAITAELNTFFPFDPYRLPRSAVFIRDVYREWSSVAIDNESDDEESDEEEEEMDQGFGVPSSSPTEQGAFLAIPRRNHCHPTRSEVGQGNGDDTTSGLGASLEQMSISPRLANTTTSTSVISITMDRVG